MLEFAQSASGKDKGLMFGFYRECAGAVVHWVTANAFVRFRYKAPLLRTLAWCRPSFW